MRHKWKDDKCKKCGIVRTRKSWKLLMAIEGSKNYYQYGTGYIYGVPTPGMPDLVKIISKFKAPDCSELILTGNTTEK